MRFPGDNKGEMIRSSISDHGIERLLSGSDPGVDELVDLMPFVAMLRSSGAWFPSESSVERFAAEASAMALASRESAPEVLPSRPAAKRPRTSLTPRLAGALAALLVFFGMTGVAVAANDAAPGDALYGLDRALERVGIGAGQAEERIEEANQLVAQGRAQEALGHVTEAFDQAEQEGEDVTDLAEARRALEAAAARLPDAETDADSAKADEEVEALLRYIRDNVHKDVGEDGREFGRRVAALARLIAINEGGGQARGEGTTTPTTDETGDDNGNGGGNGNENGNNGNENGNKGNENVPPDGSPSETAPGRGNKP